MTLFNLILAAGSSDASSNSIGTVVAVAVITALITSLIVAYLFRNSSKSVTAEEVKVEKSFSVETPLEKELVEKAGPLPMVNNGISDEVIAVIAAAVASMAPEGTKYTVKSVKWIRAQRPVWAAAGLAESTRPF